MWSLAALVIGFCIDLLVGDPHGFPHPVVLIGKCISVLERGLRCICPKTPSGERAAGAILWGAVVIVSTAVPALLLWLSGLVSPWLRLALESVMCWQILAVKSLRDESMKVYDALESGDLAASRHAVSMIVGRDTDRLDDAAVTRAAVETVAENTSDGVVAPHTPAWSPWCSPPYRKIPAARRRWPGICQWWRWPAASGGPAR